MGAGLAFAGAATSAVSSAVEGILEGKQVKTVGKKMETLKKHIRDYFLYSEMVGQFMSDKLKMKTTAAKGRAGQHGKQVYQAWKGAKAWRAAEMAAPEVRALLARSAANASAKLFGKAAVATNVLGLGMSIYSLITDCKDLIDGRQTDAIRHLTVLKHDLEDIAKGKF